MRIFFILNLWNKQSIIRFYNHSKDAVNLRMTLFFCYLQTLFDYAFRYLLVKKLCV